MAASVAVVSVLVIWTLRPTDSLARDLVTHVEYESDSWSQRTARVPRTGAGNAGQGRRRARHELRQSHVRPKLPVPGARGAASRRHNPTGPGHGVVLPNENVKHRTSFHEDGMTGVITPAPHGSIAILARGSENVDAVAQQVQQSVRWLPQP